MKRSKIGWLLASALAFAGVTGVLAHGDATGIVKDDELAGEIEDVMDFTDFCEAEGCDGHITILAA